MKCTAGQKKQDYIWNTAAGLINAAEAVVMSMFVTRMTGLADAGILSIAFTIGNQLMPIGKFGIHSYQVTDVTERFPFAVYLKSRIVTTFVMIISTCVYLLYGHVCLGYSRDKIGVVLAVCLIYAVEAVEDVIWGYYQHRDRLYVGAELFCYRWIGILLVFPAVLYFSRDLKFTLQLCFVLSVIIFAVLLKLTFRAVSGGKVVSVGIIRKVDLKEIGELLTIAFPLFGITFLSFYVNSAPKYAIDACLTDEIQACYGFVAMPVFAIGLVNNFIYQPVLVPMATEWEQKQTDRFNARIIRQLMIIAGISVVCMAGAYVLGIPVLSILYHTDLSGYKRELLILLLAGGFLAGSGYLSVVLTIMRCQRSLLWPYCLVAIMAFIGLKRIVSMYGTIGAAVCYLFLMALLCIIYGVILIYKLMSHENF